MSPVRSPPRQPSSSTVPSPSPRTCSTAPTSSSDACSTPLTTPRTPRPTLPPRPSPLLPLRRRLLQLRRRVPSKDPWRDQLEGLGSFIRSQRRLANLSLRQLADLTDVSNPYLSQIERGLHEPSVRVLQSIDRAACVSAETLLAQAGLLSDEEVGGASAEATGPHTEAAIRADTALTDAQKNALLAVYRSYLAANAS